MDKFQYPYGSGQSTNPYASFSGFSQPPQVSSASQSAAGSSQYAPSQSLFGFQSASASSQYAQPASFEFPSQPAATSSQYAPSSSFQYGSSSFVEETKTGFGAFGEDEDFDPEAPSSRSQIEVAFATEESAIDIITRLEKELAAERELTAELFSANAELKEALEAQGSAQKMESHFGDDECGFGEFDKLKLEKPASPNKVEKTARKGEVEFGEDEDFAAEDVEEGSASEGSSEENETIRALEEEIRVKDARLKERDLTILALRSTSTSLQDNADGLHASVAAMQRAANATFSDFMNELNAVSQRVRQNMANTENERVGFEERMANLDALEEELQAAKEELAKAQETHEQEMNEANEQHEAAISALEEELGAAKANDGYAKEEIAQLQKALGERETAYAQRVEVSSKEHEATVIRLTSTIEGLENDMQRARSTLFFATKQLADLTQRVQVLSLREVELRALLAQAKAGTFTQVMRQNAVSFASGCFHDTVNLVANGPFLAPNATLSVGSTWRDFSKLNAAPYNPTCVILGANVSFDEVVFNRRQMTEVENNPAICSVPTGKFAGREALEAKAYPLNAGENKVNVLFPIHIDGEKASVVLVLGETIGENIYRCSFLEKGPVLNGSEGVRLGTSENTVQAQLEHVQEDLSTEHLKRTDTLVDTRLNLDDAYVTWGAQVGSISKEELDSLKQGTKQQVILVELRQFFANVQSGVLRIDPKQLPAFNVFRTSDLNEIVARLAPKAPQEQALGFGDDDAEFDAFVSATEHEPAAVPSEAPLAHKPSDVPASKPALSASIFGNDDADFGSQPASSAASSSLKEEKPALTSQLNTSSVASSLFDGFDSSDEEELSTKAKPLAPQTPSAARAVSEPKAATPAQPQKPAVVDQAALRDARLKALQEQLATKKPATEKPTDKTDL